MSPEQREALRTRFNFKCGYCGVNEIDAGAELTVDHFHPSSQGGADDSSNWVYCCHACNEFKGNYWQPDSPKRILNPVADNFAEHFEESADGVLHGLTETGRFFIKKLRLNRDALVAHRIQRAQTELMRQHQLQLKDRLEELEAQLHELLEQVDNLRSND